jgi:hypothetical protein
MMQDWRGARVVESGGLENRCTRKGTVGSNPTLSVNYEVSSQGNEALVSRRINGKCFIYFSFWHLGIWERSHNGIAPRWKRGGS